ncbi:hypothetical protein ACFPRL_09090 [Pseudoclavibacter helvolus]
MRLRSRSRSRSRPSPRPSRWQGGQKPGERARSRPQRPSVSSAGVSASCFTTRGRKVIASA